MNLVPRTNTLFWGQFISPAAKPMCWRRAVCYRYFVCFVLFFQPYYSRPERASLCCFASSATAFPWTTSEESRQPPLWVTRMLMQTRPARASFQLCAILADTFNVLLPQRREGLWRAKTLEARRALVRTGLRLQSQANGTAVDYTSPELTKKDFKHHIGMLSTLFFKQCGTSKAQTRHYNDR